MEKEKKQGLPIDRGWAWVITFASMGLFGFISGSFKSQGVVLVELQELFPDYSAKALLWIFSLSSLVSKCAGPLNGVILAKTSNRVLSLIGVIMLTLSLSTFAYTPRPEYMYLTYGIIYGIGSGMVSLSAFTAYNPYFDKKKALSMGLTTSGSGVGTIAIPALLRMLFDNYSFSGAILIYGGVALQLAVLAALLRPMSFYEAILNSQVKQNAKCKGLPEINGNNDSLLLPNEKDVNRQRSVSFGAKSHLLVSNKAVEDEVLYSSTPHGINLLPPTVSHLTHRKHSVNLSVRELSSIQDVSSGSGILFSDLQLTDSASNETTSDSEIPIKKQSTKFNWRLAANPRCLILGLSVMCYTSGMGVAYQCIPPLGKSSDVSKAVIVALFTAAGCVEIPCRIFNGWLADRGYITAFNQLALCMMFTGSCAFICATVSGITGIAVMIVGLSSTGTSVFSLMPIASSELLGKHNVPSALAINFVYQGLGSVIATFSAGAIYDSSKRWEVVYYYICACNITGSLVMFLTSLFLYIRKRRDTQNMEIVVTESL